MITVVGLSPSLDLTYLVDALRLGEIHRPTELVRCAGGKALNLARAAATLEAPAAVVAVLGGVSGQYLRDALESAGIEVRAVWTPAETRTCVSIASADSGALTEVYQYAEAIPAPVWSELTDILASALQQRPGWLAISGGAPRGLEPDAMAALVRLGHAAGANVAVDTHGPGLVAAVDARPALVKVNRLEAAELLQVPPRTSLLSMAEQIRARCGATVVLTDGRDGALALDGQGALQADIPEVSGRFPVGSGDSFLGGLVAELDRGSAVADALRTATAAGAANAMVPGPGRFEPEQVAALRARVAVRVLPDPR